MGIIFLIVFIPSFFAWLMAVRTVAKLEQLTISVVFTGIVLALLGIICPLIMWHITGSIYVLGAPFVYLIFSVISPCFIGLMLAVSSNNSRNEKLILISNSLFFAVGLIFPFVCAYFFLAPVTMSVPALLGLKPYH